MIRALQLQLEGSNHLKMVVEEYGINLRFWCWARGEIIGSESGGRYCPDGCYEMVKKDEMNFLGSSHPLKRCKKWRFNTSDGLFGVISAKLNIFNICPKWLDFPQIWQPNNQTITQLRFYLFSDSKASMKRYILDDGFEGHSSFFARDTAISLLLIRWRIWSLLKFPLR